MKSKTLIRILVGVILALGSLVATAQQDFFVRLRVAPDVTIEVPRHWLIVKRESLQNQLAAAKALADKSNLKIGQGTKEILLQVDAPQLPSRARISLSTTTPAPYTREDLQGMPSEMLQAITEQIKKGFSRSEMPKGFDPVSVDPAWVTSYRDNPMLVISYSHMSLREPIMWRTTQCKINRGSKLVELTVSHVESESALWEPILEKTKTSIIFE